MHAISQNSNQILPIYSSIYKKAGLGVNGMTSLFKGSFYYLTTLPLKLILSPERIKPYCDIGQAHFIDGFFRLASLYFYQNCLLTSSVNRPKDMLGFIDKNKLFEMYEKHESSGELNKLFFSKSAFDKLAWTDGMCSGICSDFISKFFEALQELPFEQALLSTAQQYSDGSSEKAVLSQYMSEINSSDGPCRTNIRNCAGAVFYDNLKPLNVYATCSYENIFSDQTSAKPWMNDLPEGIYKVSLQLKTNSLVSKIVGDHRFGHSIVYSNIKNRSFTFCPNIGAIAISQDDPIESFMQLSKLYSKVFNLTHCYFQLFAEKKLNDKDTEKKTGSAGCYVS
jgi:hypothetical protein